MALLKHDDLLKLLISSAVSDRRAFIDAVGEDTEIGVETQAEIRRIQALRGKTMRQALAADREAVRLACLFSEYWFHGLADGANGRERVYAVARFKAVHVFRLSHFGRTSMETMMAAAEPVPTHKVLDLLNKQRRAAPTAVAVQEAVAKDG